MAGPTLGSSVMSAFQHGIVMAGAANLDGPTSVALIQITGWKVLAGLSVFLCSLAGVGLAISAAQGRGVLSSKPIEPDWNRINPLPNAARMLGSQPWVELVRSLLKLLIVGLAVYGSIRLSWGESVTLSQQAPYALLDVTRRYAVRMLMTAGFSYVGATFELDRDIDSAAQDVRDRVQAVLRNLPDDTDCLVANTKLRRTALSEKRPCCRGPNSPSGAAGQSRVP